MSFSISELSEEMKEETLAGKKVKPMVFKIMAVPDALTLLSAILYCFSYTLFLLSLAIESLSCHSLLFLPKMKCIGTFF